MGREEGPGGNSLFFVVLKEKRRVKGIFMEKPAERDRRLMSQKSMDLASSKYCGGAIKILNWSHYAT